MPPTAPRSARPPRRRRSRRPDAPRLDDGQRPVQHRPIGTSESVQRVLDPTAGHRADAAVDTIVAPSTSARPGTRAGSARTDDTDGLADVSSVPTASSFTELGVLPSLVSALAALGIDQPFPIQIASLPAALAGRDVLARGRTGSGKTIAFALPVVSRLAAGARSAGTGNGRPRQPRALVLVPTRELATQVAATFEPLAAALGQRVTTIFGGVSQVRQERALAAGVDIIIACPGRLEDLIAQRRCSLEHIEVTVLDEADHLADLGFLPAVRRLLDRTPAGGQRLLFSATLDAQVDAVVRRYLQEPVRCSVDPVATAPAQIDHHVLSVAATDKAAIVTELASGEGPTLLFTRTKHSARKLARRLAKEGIAAVDLHGDLAQNARERNMAAFRDGSARVLVATDIAARGIHVDGVALVVHVDPPAEAKAFTHRSGRTARAGSDGTVVTIATPDQRRDVDKLTTQAAVRPTITTVGVDHPLLAELRGPRAPLAPPPPVPAATTVTREGLRRTNRPSGRRRGPR